MPRQLSRTWCAAIVGGALLHLSPLAVSAPALHCDARPLTSVPAGLPASRCAAPADACAGIEIAGGGPRIQGLTRAIAPGPEAFLHIRADAAPADVDVRIGGELTSLMYQDDPKLGAVYPLPSELPACALSVTIAPRGGAVTDCASVEVKRPWFEELARPAGVAVLHNTEDELAPEFPASTGLAFGDFDGDGDADLYIANFGLPGILFRNDTGADGRWRFVDVSAESGVDGIFRGSAATFVDYDGDGDLDLFVGRDGTDRLFANRLRETGKPRFEDVSRETGIWREGQRDEDAGRTTSAAFGDYDQDGRLDLYVATHLTHLNTGEDMHQDHLFWNAGGRFEDVTTLLDNRGPATRLVAFAAAWVDIDRDGDPDLVVASDHDSFSARGLVRPNVLWMNAGAGGADGRTWRFVEQSELSGFAMYPDGKGQGLNAMGLAIADVDGDGDPDFAMSNIGPNALLRNNSRPGAPRFTDIARSAGAARTYLPWQPETPAGNRRAAWQDMSITWGTHFLDADNDGDQDLFFAGGAPIDNYHGGVFGRRPIPNAFLVNNGRTRFTEQTFSAGLGDPGPGMGTAIADIDRDGWMDLAVFSYKGRFRLYRNRGGARWPQNRALRVALVGRDANTAALGAEVTLTDDSGRQQRCFNVPAPGLAGGSEPGCHFGLGTATPARLTIRWPDGEEMDVKPVPTAGAALECRRP